jgi:hypothetical protein
MGYIVTDGRRVQVLVQDSNARMKQMHNRTKLHPKRLPRILMHNNDPEITTTTTPTDADNPVCLAGFITMNQESPGK